MKEGFESIHNRFYVRGEGEYLYQYNYGNLAGDPRTAALNPLHALGTIEPTLEKFRKERTLLEKDVPQLRQIIEGTWRKEADLAALKKEMEQLDRQIQLALKPVGSDRDGEEAGEQQEQRQEKDARREAPAADDLQRHIPARLRQIADASGGRIVIGGVPPRTDDDFHPKNQTINGKALHFIFARLSRFIGYRCPDRSVYSLSEPSGDAGGIRADDRPGRDRRAGAAVAAGKRPGEGGLPPRRSPACRGNIVGKGAGRKTRRYGTPQKPERLTTLRQPKNN